MKSKSSAVSQKSPPAPYADNRLELLFQHAGLSDKEAKLYRILLATGEERASILSRKSGIKRTNVYALLANMKRNRLVTEFTKGKIAYFRPEPPNRLLEIIESRKKSAKVAEELAHDLVPMMTSQWKTALERPVVRYFEGEEGIHTVFEDIYAPKNDPVWGCVDLEKADEAFPSHIAKTLIPKRIRNKVQAETLLSDSPAAQEVQKHDASQLRETKLTDKTTYPFPAEIDVYEDKIAMLSFEKGNFVGILIENKVFAESLRSVFKMAFEHENAAFSANSRL